MKNPDLYINHQGKRKRNLAPLVDSLLMIGIGVGMIVAVVFFITYL